MMTIEQKKKTLARIASTEADIETLRRVRIEIAARGFSSATLASGGGSKSYTRHDLDKITALVSALEREVGGLRRLLAPAPPAMPSITYTVYS